MSSIVLLYGGFNVDFEAVAQYFAEELGYQIIKLPFLQKEHFSNGKISSEVKAEFGEQTLQIVRKYLGKWKTNKIIYPIYFKEQTEVVKIRAYIHIIEVKQPFMVGYQKYLQDLEQKDLKNYNYYIKSQKMLKIENENKDEQNDTLQEFVLLDDAIRFQTDVSQLQTFTRHSINCESAKKIEECMKQDAFLVRLNLNQFRPLMQEYFMSIAYLARLRSNCMKKAVGCVIVRDDRIVSIGYNGTPVGAKNCFEGGCERCNSNVSGGTDLDKCLCIHAEDSAILQVGSQNVQGGTLFTTLFPCTWCSKVILQSKIKHVIYSQDYPDREGKKLLEQADVILRKMDFYFHDKI